jgi:hypothetical protein
MKQALVRCVIVGLGVLLLSSVVAKGRDFESARPTLRGLEGVQVVIEDLDPDVERAGLTRHQLQTDVELRLRKAGIRVFTRPGSPFLSVHVLTRKLTPLEVYAYSIDIEFHQLIYLVRDPHVINVAPTWSVKSGIGTVGATVLRQLRERVADHVDEFINAYLAVNPEQAGRTLPPEPSQPSIQKSTIPQAQERLASKGFNPGPLDGQMGVKMQAALRQFQRAHGLAPTGELDEATRAALGLE